MDIPSVSSESRYAGLRYATDVQSLAFQLWAFKHSRNCTETARALIRDWRAEWGALPTLEPLSRTVRNWADREQWASRVRTAIAAIAPDIDTQIIVNNMANALKASVVMGDVLDGRFSASEGRTRAYAAQIAFNHAGYDAASMLERIKEASANRGAEFNPAALAQLSPDELAERADRIRRGLPIDLPLPTTATTPDDISHDVTTVDNTALHDALPAENTTPSPAPSYADGRDSSGGQEDRRQAGPTPSATHESGESE